MINDFHHFAAICKGCQPCGGLVCLALNLGVFDSKVDDPWQRWGKGNGSRRTSGLLHNRSAVAGSTEASPNTGQFIRRYLGIRVFDSVLRR